MITRRDQTQDLEYFCEVCNKTYKKIEDAKAQAMKPCGYINKQGDTTNGKVCNQNNKCYYCELLYSENAALERHNKEKHHDSDCPKCNAIFKTEEDLLKHASVCSEAIEPHICTKCNRELITKSGLEKHIKRCEGKQDKEDTKKSDEICTNGSTCKYLKADRCRYTHIEGRHQPWQKVQNKKQRHQQKQLSQQQNHHQKKKQEKNVKHFQNRQEQIKCKNGISCIYLK